MQYNGFSEVKAISYGSGDSDILGYDPNTGRMTGYQQNVGSNGLSLTGSLTWNTNGTLQSLNTTDQFVAANIQNCGYTYDDLARLGQVDCGAGKWAQTFTYDPFGNISKSVPNLPGGRTGQSFNPVYSAATNQYSSLTGVTPPYYDSNGNVTSDGFHYYAWDAEGKMSQIDSGASNWTFDALGRWVERADSSGNYVQAVYDPTGSLLAQTLNGQTLRQARLPLVAGAAAQYAYNGNAEPSWGTLNVYWHPDWLGTSRLQSTPDRRVSADPSMAPFGEQQWTQEGIDTLWSSIGASDKTLITTLDFPPSPALPFVIKLDLEEMLVTDIGSFGADTDADDYSIIRGWNGTTAAAHNAGTEIYLVNAATVFTGAGFQDKALDLADFPNREYHSVQGRWVSPDPAGMAAVDPTNPQTWNRYAYVSNNPTSLTDPSGLDEGLPCDIWLDPWDCGFPLFPLPPIFVGGGGGGGGGGYSGGRGPATPPTGGSPVDFPNGETLGLPNGVSIPNLGLPDLLGLSSAGTGCDFGACGGGAMDFSGGGGDPSTQIKSLYDNIVEHLEKIAAEPNSPAGQHWKAEIENWIKQILKKAGKRPGSIDKYLQRIIGISGSDLENLLPSPVIIVNPCIINPLAPYCSIGPYNGPA